MGLIAQGLIALLLFAAGGVIYKAGERELVFAEAARALATLQYDTAIAKLDAAGESSLLDRATSAIGLGTDRIDAAISYWVKDYSSIDAQQHPMLAANAAFHQLQAEGGDWKVVVSRLDEVVKQYGEILRADPGNIDAAYNYEFASRYRAAIASTRQPVPAAEPGGVTLHGVPGAPPRGTDMKQFKMIVPMQPNERQEAEQAGRAGTRQRKG